MLTLVLVALAIGLVVLLARPIAALLGAVLYGLAVAALTMVALLAIIVGGFLVAPYVPVPPVWFHLGVVIATLLAAAAGFAKWQYIPRGLQTRKRVDSVSVTQP